LTLLVVAARPTAAQVAETPRPAYPRINLATGYEVVSSWPAAQKDRAWGAMAGIAVGRNDEIWTFNRGKTPVQVFSADGRLLRSWGEGQFREPHQVRIDRQGNVWLVDSGLNCVRKYTSEGKLLLTLGTPGEPGEDSTHMNRPTDVAVTSEGELFVTDGYGNNRIVHFDKAGQFVAAWGSVGTEPGQISLPHSIAVDSRGRLYVADRNNARIQVFDQTGRWLDEWRDLMVPWHIAITDRDEIYVCGSSPMRWPRFRVPGLVVGIPPKDQLVLVFARDGRVDRRGTLYLGDIQGRRAQKFLRLDPSPRDGEVATKSLPKRDEPVERAGSP
jgi:sugar lactone lactonase YvrE